MAKDLRQEIYPFFSTLFHAIVQTMDPREPEIVEAAFTSLVLLFKFLSRQLVRDIEKGFLYAVPSPLFGFTFFLR